MKERIAHSLLHISLSQRILWYFMAGTVCVPETVTPTVFVARGCVILFRVIVIQQLLLCIRDVHKEMQTLSQSQAWIK